MAFLYQMRSFSSEHLTANFIYGALRSVEKKLLQWIEVLVNNTVLTIFTHLTYLTTLCFNLGEIVLLVIYEKLAKLRAEPYYQLITSQPRVVTVYKHIKLICKYPWKCAQTQLWETEQNLPVNTMYNMPQYYTDRKTYAQVWFNSRYWLHCHSNLRVSVTTIENLKLWIGGDIIRLTFGKSVTL